MLIVGKFDFTLKNNASLTPLMLAVFRGHKQAVGMIVTNIKSVNTQNRTGATALHFAVAKGSPELVEILLSHPTADSEIRDSEGSTAFDLAKPEDFIALHKLKMNASNKRKIGIANLQVTTSDSAVVPAENVIFSASQNHFNVSARRNIVDSKSNSHCSEERSNELVSELRKAPNFKKPAKNDAKNHVFDDYRAEPRLLLKSDPNPLAKIKPKSNFNELKRYLMSKPISSMDYKNAQASHKKPAVNITSNVSKSNRLATTSSGTNSAPAKKMLKADSSRIGINSFKLHSILGVGSFGNVYLVEKNDTGQFFAMKVLDKRKTLRDNLKRYVLAEKNILSCMNHPFITKLYYAFQNSEYLFLIMQYCSGGNLGRFIRKQHFTENKIRNYACEILLALEELHSHNIIYRDLKPENVMLDAEGHALLIDFGLSKENVIDYQHGTSSFCGSVAYLAPEMI